MNGIQKPTKEMEKEYKFGLTDPATTASGRMEWLRATADWSTPKAISTKVPGISTKQTDTESTRITAEVVMKDNGSKINKTEKVLRNGRMAQSMLVTTKRVSNTATANLSGAINALMMENSRIIT